MSAVTATLALPLQTRRLVIRDYTAADAAAVLGYVQDPAYWQYQRGDPPTLGQIETLMQWVTQEQATSPRTMYFFAATRKDTGEIIGEGVLKVINPAERQGEIGFGVAPKYWKQGYGTEIATAVLEAAFAHFKLHRVAGQCSPDNKGSIRVMQKLGMGREGLLRDIYHARGKWWSTLIYGILDHEYAKIKSIKTA
ncbi:MAG: GNAT family N-acetyltransferase [Rhodospirillaceae bacterium]|nr:GNAT family N-acetyltransferase [Rhodospirillaceae bacterium]